MLQSQIDNPVYFTQFLQRIVPLFFKGVLFKAFISVPIFFGGAFSKIVLSLLDAFFKGASIFCYMSF